MKNETVQVNIEKIVSNGNGIARIDGKALFVPLSAPGDELDVRIVESKKKYAIGSINKIIKPSNSRVEAPCEYYGVCGGCDLQHISDDLYSNVITENLSDNLKKIGGFKDIENSLKPSLLSKKRFSYRVKGRFQYAFRNGAIKIGFNKRKSNDVVDIDKCLLMESALNKKFIELKQYLKNCKQPFGESFEFQIISLDKSAAIFSFENRNKVFFDYLISARIFDYLEIWANNKLYFSSQKSFEMHYDNDSILPGSFIQCNPEINIELKNTIKNNLYNETLVLDLYCGYGNLSLGIARSGTPVIGIESNFQSTHFFNKENNYKIIKNTVEKGIGQILANKFSTIILDPPREGASSILRDILKLSPEKIIYISCNSATLSRDLKILSSEYELKICQAFDMFPQTSHFEIFTLLEKKK